DGQDHRRKDWPEEHAWLGWLDRTVDRVKDPVAEYAIAIEVVGNRDVKYLIEIPELPVRAVQNSQPERNESQKEDSRLDGAIRKKCVVGHCCRVAPVVLQNSTGVTGRDEWAQTEAEAEAIVRGRRKGRQVALSLASTGAREGGAGHVKGHIFDAEPELSGGSG